MTHSTSASIRRRQPRTQSLGSIANDPIAPSSSNASVNVEQELRNRFDQLERQLGQLKEQTRQAQKMASLGAAATMLAHEFNNLMTPVVSYSRFALDADDRELMIKALKMTLRQTEIVTSMSDRILGLASNDAQSYQPVRLIDAVEDAVGCMCRDLSKDGINLKVNLDDGLIARADPKQLQQVLFNLLINARQAIPHRNGRIQITGKRTSDQSVELRVRDNGCGISPENLERIFQQFFSTKTDRPNGSGVGMGLSLCQEIVEEHGGEMSVESTVGEGATFIIKLPSATIDAK